MKNKTTFIVLGSSHSDPVPYSVLIRLFNALSEKNIPCAFMQECASDKTLADAADNLANLIKHASNFKQVFPEIQGLYKKDEASNLMYLPRSASGVIERAVATKLMPTFAKEMQNKANLLTIVTAIYSESANRDNLALLQTLAQLKIHFAGIEADTKTRLQTQAALEGGDAAVVVLFAKESSRINCMVSNVMSDALKRFPNGGIVIISVGRAHSHRLVANLLEYAKTNQLDLTRFNFHAFNLCSSVVEENASLQDALPILSDLVDSSAIKKIYQSLPCPTVGSKNLEDVISFQELELLVDKLTRDFATVKAPSQPIFFPPNPHDSFIIDIKKYSKLNPDILSAEFVTRIETSRDYSLALRNFCAWGNATLIELVIRYSNKLPIDFNEVSRSNGNTPLTWFEKSSASEVEKAKVIPLLKEKMTAKNACPGAAL